MAEGGRLERLLGGGEGEEPDADAGLAGTDAVAIAVAMDAARYDPELARKAGAYLDKQARLVDIQTEHLHEQRAVQISHLKLRRLSDRLKIGLQLFTALVATALALAVVGMVWSATRDRGLVIEAFSVPPDLARDGLTGQVVATRLLDKISAIQRTAGSVRMPASFKNNWGDDTSVQIPQTGISVADLGRFLRRKLGHETRITGEVVRTKAGLMVSARAGSAPASDASGPDAEVDRLLQETAERLYADVQPYLYATYLGKTGQREAARAQYAHVAAIGSPGERAWGFLGWSVLLTEEGEFDDAVEKAQSGYALDPANALTLADISAPEMARGHDEVSLAWARAGERILGSARMRRELNPEGWPITQQRLAERVAQSTGDHQTALAVSRAVAAMPEHNNSGVGFVYMAAVAAAALHDVRASRAILAGAPSDPARMHNSGGSLKPGEDAGTARMLQAITLDDWPGVVAAARDQDAWQQTDGKFGARRRLVWTLPWLAYGLARTGEFAEARTLIAATPLDCYFCIRMRGKIAAAAGDWAGARRWLLETVRQGPSLPFAYANLGEMLLARGDLNGAIAEFSLANAKDPHFADPLELWGEALMKKGDPRDAVGRFEQAARFAPRWGHDRLMWGEALAKLGNADAARVQLRLAASMDLSPADRATLTTLKI